MKKVLRTDQGNIRSSEMTKEGFLKFFATVTRTGVFTYQNPDGSLRRELRHPDEVFSRHSLDSMRMIPITNNHPPERLVSSENSKRLSVGNVGEAIEPDGKNVDASGVIQDKDALEAVRAGRNQLSLGYELELVEDPGEYDGERYDFRQTNIRYNHLALVDQARAGKEAQIVLDSADAVQVHKDTKNPSKETKMKGVKVRLDNGCEYEDVPQEVAAALTASQAQVKTLSSDLTAANSRADKAEAERDTTKAELKKAQEANNDEAIREAVKARTDLVALAQPHLDEDTVKKLPNMSAAEIKTAIVVKTDKDFNADGKSDEYVQARFDAAIGILGKPANKSNGISSQRQQVHGDMNDGGNNGNRGTSREDGKEPDASASRKAYEERLRNDWQDNKAA